MDDTLLLTKLFIPNLSGTVISRKRLLDLLSHGFETGRSLTLVSAPAGYGKSTLLAEWVALYPNQVAWISLDAQDNDYQRFWMYVLVALKRISSEKDQSEILELIELIRAGDFQVFLTSLVNTIVLWDRRIILVLDDFHLLSSSRICEDLSFLISQRLGALHVAISTRIDPPFLMSRLRVRSLLTEIRVSDLRFTRDEAKDYLTDQMRINLDDVDISALENRTEGWIAGLHLAAMSMQNLEDVHAFVKDFAGTQYLILEYLVDEVIKTLQESEQKLLLETSILTRICAPLCTAVTGLQNCEDLIGYLYRKNLFIIPLDNDRFWFRYHHLFAQVLISQLKRERAKDIVLLHRRAALWYQEQGYPSEAVHHALAMEDYAFAGHLVIDNWRSVYHTGDLYTAKKWLEMIPKEHIQQSPVLGVAFCWTLFIRGRYREIEVLLGDIELSFNRLIEKGSLQQTHPEYQIVLHQVTLLQAIVLRHSGEVEKSITLIKALLPKIEALRHSMGQTYADMGYTASYSQLGYSYAAIANYEKAEDYLRRVSVHARSCENYFGLAHATFAWSNIANIQKNHTQALEICFQELHDAEQKRIDDYPAFCLIQLALAQTYLEIGNLQESETYLHKGLKTAKRSGHEYYLAQGYLIAAKLCYVQKKNVLMQEFVDQAMAIGKDIQNNFLDKSIEIAKGQVHGQIEQNVVEELSTRELEVLRLICEGQSNQEIAETLYISLNTVKRHVNNIFNKMGVQRRSQAIRQARQLDLC